MGRLASRVFHAVRMFRMMRMFRMPRIANRRLNVMRRADGDGND